MSLVSIAIITYNRPALLKHSIDAILNQSYEDIELLVIDNGSTFETTQLLNKYNDPRIRIFKNDSNFREFYNYPFFVAKGKYLIITHDDDIMHPGLVQKELEEVLNNPCVVAVSCNMRGIDNNGDVVIEKLNVNEENILYSKGDFWKLFNSNNYIFTPTVMFDLDFMKRKSLIFEHERIGPACDQFLWYKILQNDVKISVLSEVLYDYRLHENQDSVVNGPKMNFDLSLSLIELNLSNNKELYRLFESLFSNINNYKNTHYGKYEMKKVFFLLKNSELNFNHKFLLIFNFKFPTLSNILKRISFSLFK